MKPCLTLLLVAAVLTPVAWRVAADEPETREAVTPDDEVEIPVNGVVGLVKAVHRDDDGTLKSFILAVPDEEAQRVEDLEVTVTPDTSYEDADQPSDFNIVSFAATLYVALQEAPAGARGTAVTVSRLFAPPSPATDTLGVVSQVTRGADGRLRAFTVKLPPPLQDRAPLSVQVTWRTCFFDGAEPATDEAVQHGLEVLVSGISLSETEISADAVFVRPPEELLQEGENLELGGWVMIQGTVKKVSLGEDGQLASFILTGNVVDALEEAQQIIKDFTVIVTPGTEYVDTATDERTTPAIVKVGAELAVIVDAVEEGAPVKAQSVMGNLPGFSPDLEEVAPPEEESMDQEPVG